MAPFDVDELMADEPARAPRPVCPDDPARTQVLVLRDVAAQLGVLAGDVAALKRRQHPLREQLNVFFGVLAALMLFGYMVYYAAGMLELRLWQEAFLHAQRQQHQEAVGEGSGPSPGDPATP